MKEPRRRNPWSWIPTLYFAQGLPYVAVMTVSVIMYKRLGISNTDIALYTGWLYLPWVIKPLWSPFVDMFATKRRWTLAMQWLLAVGMAAVAFSIPAPLFFQLTLAAFWLIGLTSATHDIAADGFYMLALTPHDQSLYVGVRSTFYRVATVAGQGLLVVVAGLIESGSGLKPVEITVNAGPDTQWSAPAITETVIDSESGLDGEMQFVLTSAELDVSSTAPAAHDGIEFKAYSAMMRDSVSRLNEANGFVGKSEAATIVRASGSDDKPSAFSQWLSDTFGEKRRQSVGRVDNFAVVGLSLNRRPADDETIVINVAHKSDDRSIRLEQNSLSPRFSFDKDNWNKTAYLLFEVDHKLSDRAVARFEGTSGNIPLAWMTVFGVLSAFFLIVSVYHSRVLPHPVSDDRRSAGSLSQVFSEFVETFGSFFRKKQILTALAFMLLYRLPEAQLVKMINPFLLDPIDKGGLGLTTGQVGIVYGTVGIIGLTLGGIIGGIAASRGGLKKWLKPMAWSMSLTCLAFVYLSYATDLSLLTINLCVFIEQFGYGFGFTAYTLYLIYFSEGRHKTAHYAICTGFMALGMMLPGMAAGWLQECIGYRHFFIWTMICCVATIGVCSLLKIDPAFGRKNK